jgi:hypothetical protein
MSVGERQQPATSEEATSVKPPRAMPYPAEVGDGLTSGTVKAHSDCRRGRPPPLWERGLARSTPGRSRFDSTLLSRRGLERAGVGPGRVGLLTPEVSDPKPAPANAPARARSPFRADLWSSSSVIFQQLEPSVLLGTSVRVRPPWASLAARSSLRAHPATH